MVLARKINKRLVAEINLVASASGFAIPTVIMSSSESAVLGIVNDQVSRVDPSVLHSILADGHIPMIAFVAADEAGKGYNVNTDIADGEPMVAVRFEKGMQGQVNTSIDHGAELVNGVDTVRYHWRNSAKDPASEARINAKRL
ncbi:acetylglutamate kinase, chloroplastic-like [Dioscorea cayenensis subsp. rotundata]|uniref:Acetylglutamate kinase, chloroplastic-like n=1 Tax=Dioscorea cayennensis subsp. rotundata TaxID=55577 RepID=A0AB40AX72_DIOCR|nr:acetylglutamate kinase, chloroplastic-like [Dioscorea cayenensis subsp. rotundata]